MARHNVVNLYGQISQEPKINKNENGDYIWASFVMNISRGKRSMEDEELGEFAFDCPVIISRNSDLISKIINYKINDIILLKGIISTREIMKKYKCPNCEHENPIKKSLTYITPIYLDKLESCLDYDEGINLLKKNCEISNQVLVTGHVCNDPDIYVSAKNGKISQYQLALNRKFRIKEDPAEIRTDYPWIKSTGINAENDKEYIKKGSTVLVDGYLHTRKYEKEIECTECKNTFKIEDIAMEIVSYATEYLLNQEEDSEEYNYEE